MSQKVVLISNFILVKVVLVKSCDSAPPHCLLNWGDEEDMMYTYINSTDGKVDDATLLQMTLYVFIRREPP